MSTVWLKLEQRTQPWYDFRAKGPDENPYLIAVGASEAGACLADPLSFARNKLLGTEEPTNFAMEEGTKREDRIREHYVEKTGIVGAPAVCYNTETPFLFSSLDHVSPSHDTVAEFKMMNAHDFSLVCNGTVPERIMPQLQRQMHDSGVDFVHLVVQSYHGSFAPILVVERDQSLIDELVASAGVACKAAGLKPVEETGGALVTFLPPLPAAVEIVSKAWIVARDEACKQVLAINKIDSPELADNVGLTKSALRKLALEAEEARKKATRVLDEAKGQAMAVEREFTAPIDVATSHCSKLLLGWEQRVRQEEEERKRKLEEEIKAKLAAGVPLEEAREEAQAAAPPPPPSRKVAGAAFQWVPEFEIVDADKVDVRYKVVSEALVREELKRLMEKARPKKDADPSSERFAELVAKAGLDGVKVRLDRKTKSR